MWISLQKTGTTLKILKQIRKTANKWNTGKNQEITNQERKGTQTKIWRVLLVRHCRCRYTLPNILSLYTSSRITVNYVDSPPNQVSYRTGDEYWVTRMASLWPTTVDPAKRYQHYHREKQTGPQALVPCISVTCTGLRALTYRYVGSQQLTQPGVTNTHHRVYLWKTGPHSLIS